MKNMQQFMLEARAFQQDLIEQQEVIGGITNAQIFDAIADVVGDEPVTEEQLYAIYESIVEDLEADYAQMLEEQAEDLDEEHDVELKPHPKKPGTHYIVHNISKKSGIESDQLKTGETLNDTHVDDLKDMGYSVKIHKGE